ncbi:AfsR/SARP family transcriptional regulator [Streptomyces sp. ISL-94]|uniref:AfsR/SARP family transcriptional regulator n=1 Tax=Streptomyces sp. ISL-94 TaxID=2819190 RepID=UPI001BE843D0|nr:AfsR/SARP family transcriptional regulator [Streptomyces sp. ISL-94]MBT2479357.1 AfsR/SARP family transcriptional regulator [Streptomyces sp. ISL-94]
MRYELMGPFRVLTDHGRVLLPGTPKVSQLLALLLMRANEFVPREMLIQELWQQNPPRSALNTLQTYVHHARRLLAEGDRGTGARQAGPSPLVTQPGGYVMRVDEASVDIKLFEQLVARGEFELRMGNSEEAVDVLTRALALWHGSALFSIRTGDVLAGHVVRLEELRIRAFELRIGAMKDLGRLRAMVPELRALVEEYPLNECFHGVLISALHQAGRRPEALHAYQKVRQVLRDELGLELSPWIRRLHEEMLAPAVPT